MRAAIASIILLAGCGSNAPMVGKAAPALQGGEWIQPDGTASTVASEGRWVVAAFLIPT